MFLFFGVLNFFLTTSVVLDFVNWSTLNANAKKFLLATFTIALLGWGSIITIAIQNSQMETPNMINEQ